VRRRFQELKETIDQLKSKAPLWEGRLPRAQVTMVLDYHAHWALLGDAMGADLDYLRQFAALYGLLRRKGLAVDLISPAGDPSGYDLVVAPMPVIGRDKVAERWQSCAAAGAVLLVTAPAGYRTEQNTWAAAPPPGPYTHVLGVEVVEHDALGPDAGPTVELEGQTLAARSFCSLIELRGAETLGAYASGAYCGSPAVTGRREGEGQVCFLGALGGVELYDAVLELAMEQAGLSAHPWASEAVEVVPLAGEDGDGASLLFVLNHGAEPAVLSLPEGGSARDLLADRDVSAELQLDPYGVALLEI
jgi:beta-galactosidase